MSDAIKHECGIALIRLRKPLSYYKERYGTPLYGVNKLYLLMEKQHNRGQDGAGVATIKLDVDPGSRYISRHRSADKQPINKTFEHINGYFRNADPAVLDDPERLKRELPFTGELLLGHLRYGTYGKNKLEHCHPQLRQNNWMTRNLVVAGNFNLTNVDELFDLLVSIGQHPKEKSDTVTVLEKIGHFLDVDNDRMVKQYQMLGYTDQQITDLMAEKMDIPQILKNSSADWDGGYAMAGLFGHGSAFVLRDPNGIRPAFWYADDEVVVVASERPAIRTAFDLGPDDVKELTPGHALVIQKDGSYAEERILGPREKKSCSFERIYFSRGSDQSIYRERQDLGKLLCPKILEAIDHDLENSVFSFIPNTAEVAYFGMIKGMEERLNDIKTKRILELGPTPDPAELKRLLELRMRVEKVAIKDAKLRTFITNEETRDDLVTHVYDITYGSVNRGQDNLIMIDDSIVRGTTLKQSILRILDRLGPKRIVVVSSAPQIRYPDCYGIDMAKMGDLIAFEAAIQLLKETKQENVIDDAYERAMEQIGLPKEQQRNVVKAIYAPFSAERISEKISELLTPPELNAEVKIIYQSISGLHAACPDHLGDWYFSGDYPTPGGNRVVNQAFINYMTGQNIRAY